MLLRKCKGPNEKGKRKGVDKNERQNTKPITQLPQDISVLENLLVHCALSALANQSELLRECGVQLIVVRIEVTLGEGPTALVFIPQPLRKHVKPHGTHLLIPCQGCQLQAT